MIEEHFEEAYVAGLSAREKQIQQHYRPAIAVHKWFARRSGALFRSLLLAEFVDQDVSQCYELGHELVGRCLDPFMGGGTPLLEASRLGLAVIGYDTNPMARWIVERSLEDLDPDLFLEAGRQVITELEPQVQEHYLTRCPLCERLVDARYFIWVRTYDCPGCGIERPFLADTLIVSPGLHRYAHEIQLCPRCQSLCELASEDPRKTCTTCGWEFGPATTRGTPAPCQCGAEVPDSIESAEGASSCALVAVEYRCPDCRDGREYGGRLFKAADAEDQARYEAASAPRLQSSPFWPETEIPNGDETSRLRRCGYEKWSDLFNGRQLRGLGLLAQRLSTEPDGPVKRALLTAFSDFLRYQNMLCRYDRQALKPIDVFGLHGFAMPRVICEVPLLGSRTGGSGGFRNAVAKYARAKRWCKSPYELTADGRKPTPPERVAAKFVKTPQELASRGALLRCGSLSSASPADRSDVVLTDPPYYASVQYGELMDFCYQWLRILAPETEYFDVDSASSVDDAVGSRSRGIGLVDFSVRLSRVFMAATEALAPGGPFCFTYHHVQTAAYAPIVVACLDSGLIATTAYACPSEMRVSSHIRSRSAGSIDTVFVLRKPPLSTRLTAFGPDQAESLLARQLHDLETAKVHASTTDEACLRLGTAAMAAIASCGISWRPADPIAARYARALEAVSSILENLS